MCTGPDSRTDTITLIGRAVRNRSGNGCSQRIKLLHHIWVSRITAAGKKNALLCIVAYQITGFCLLCNNAGYSAGIVLLKLYKSGIEIYIITGLADDFEEYLISLHTVLTLGSSIVVLLLREVECCILITLRPACFCTGCKVTLPVVWLILEDAGYEIMHGCGFI